MPFADHYVNALNSNNLKDDELHRKTEALAASALADLNGGQGNVFGSMLTRAKYGNGARKAFEAGAMELAGLLRAWKQVVAKRGLERGWFPKPRAEWDANAVIKRYHQIAEQSLAHWLGGNCEACGGSTVGTNGLTCKPCAGTGKAPILGDNTVADRTRDMVSELEGLYQAHSARAGAKMRQAA
jgi:hypothetical protein